LGLIAACIAFSVTLLPVCDRGHRAKSQRARFTAGGLSERPGPVRGPESAAWDYIHIGKNRREYTLAELAYMERRIKSAARRLGVTLGGKPAIS
jgi:hypothetical protein